MQVDNSRKEQLRKRWGAKGSWSVSDDGRGERGWEFILWWSVLTRERGEGRVD